MKIWYNKKDGALS